MSAGEALDHYVDRGYRESLDPHPLFDSAFYQAQCPNLAEAGINPLYHFLTEGAAGEPALNPHLLFDTAFYYWRYPEVREQRLNPLVHYLQSGGANYDPNPFFDSAYYHSQLGGQELTASLLEHYLCHTGEEALANPNRLFDTEYFKKHNRETRTGEITPLEFYLGHGWKHGRLISNKVSRYVIRSLHLEDGLFADGYLPQRIIMVLFARKLRWLARCRVRRTWRLIRRDAEVFLVASKHLLQSPKCRWLDAPYTLEKLVRHPGFSAELATLLAALKSPHKPTLVLSDQPERLQPLLDYIDVSSIRDTRKKLPANLRRVRPRPDSAVPGKAPRPDPKETPILFPVLDWSISGVNRWIENLSLELQARGWNVNLLVSNELRRYSDPSELPEVPRMDFDLPCTKTSMWWNAARDFLESLGPAVLFTGYDFRFNSLASVAGHHTSFVGVLHSDDPVYYAEAERLGHHFRHIVAVADQIRGGLLSRHPEWETKTSVIPYGIRPVDEEAAPQPPRGNAPIRLVYTGRVVNDQKRVFRFVPLVKELESRGIPYHFTIVGEGLDKSELMWRLDRSVSSGNVHFTGKLPKDDIDRILSRSHVFILTSDFEGLPLSLLEAISHGCVPVVPDIDSGIPQAVTDGVDGFIIPGCDLNKFADVIGQLLEDPQLWARVSRAARDVFAEKFTVARMAEEYEQVILSVLEKNPVAAPGTMERPEGCDYFGDIALPNSYK